MCEHVYTDPQGAKDEALGNTPKHHQPLKLLCLTSMVLSSVRQYTRGRLICQVFQSNFMIDSQMEKYNKVVML